MGEATSPWISFRDFRRSLPPGAGCVHVVCVPKCEQGPKGLKEPFLFQTADKVI